MSKLKVINLFGPPGVGKSTAAAGLFYLMKRDHFSVEQVTEYAKYLILSGNEKTLQNEPGKLLAEQYHKQEILTDFYDYAITDSPLPLVSYYNQKTPKSFSAYSFELFDEFDNINLFITRDLTGDAQYETEGRIHTKDQSIKIEQELREYLSFHQIHFVEFNANRFIAEELHKHIKRLVWIDEQIPLEIRNANPEFAAIADKFIHSRG